ncbi:MAG: NADH-quinone oxidoreductase subunit L, partial [Planctomycetota bacterium]
SHGHDAHGHYDQGHDAHLHDAHGHGGHGHGGGFPFSLGQLVALLVVSLIGGYLVELVLPVSGLTLENLLKQSQPAGLQHADVIAEGRLLEWSWPNEHFSHAPEIKIPVTLLATGTWILGITLATLLYATGTLNPADVRKQFSAAYNFLVNKWWFDELYDRLFVRPTKSISTVVAGWDKNYIDRLLDQLAATTKSFSNLWDRLIDRRLGDGRANWLASVTYRLGLSLRGVQTGKLRQYVMFIVLGAIAVFVLISFFWSTSLAK